MSWGFRITFLYVGFVALIVTLVITSMQNKTELVAADYYAQELKFQERIEASSNALELSDPIEHRVTVKGVELTFPADRKDLSGEITFFRPSDAKQDFKIVMQPGSDSTQFVARDRFTKGMYKMQLTWQQKGKKYFKEEVIFIQ